jgi:NAD(P)H-hydrate epimerase
MAAMDRATIEQFGLPGMALMESAGRSVVGAMRQQFGDLRGKRVAIFCGKGNNGGDGYVVARYLQKLGSLPKVYLHAPPDQISGDARTNLDIIEKMGLPIFAPGEWEHASACQSADILVDALLGTGVKGALKGEIAELVAAINQSRAPIVAIDLPTGVETDTGRVPGEAIHATLTVTMAALKRGLCFWPGREHAGVLQIADIGFPEEVIDKVGARAWWVCAPKVAAVLPHRAPDTYKNACGQVLIVSGSVGKTGAAALASEAVLRVGAGMAILAIPASLDPIVEELLLEVMTLPLPETEEHCFAFDATTPLAEHFDWADVMAIGPGITTHPEVCQLVTWVLQNYPKPMVVDADAINCLSEQPELLKSSPQEIVITPHPGELSRLTGIPGRDIVAEPIEVARRTAADLGVVVVLKGAPTVVATPAGDVYVNGSGNPGMATAGMGDVLTGVIAGLMAQGLPAAEAAVLGVFVHGLAGDRARDALGVYGMIAKDVLHELPEALNQLAKESTECPNSSVSICQPSFGLWP